MSYIKFTAFLVITMMTKTALGDSGEFEIFAKCDGVISAAHDSGLYRDHLDQTTSRYISSELMSAAFSEDSSKMMQDYQELKSQGRRWFHESQSNETASDFVISICGQVSNDAINMNEAKRQ